MIKTFTAEIDGKQMTINYDNKDILNEDELLKALRKAFKEDRINKENIEKQKIKSDSELYEKVQSYYREFMENDSQLNHINDLNDKLCLVACETMEKIQDKYTKKLAQLAVKNMSKYQSTNR